MLNQHQKQMLLIIHKFDRKLKGMHDQEKLTKDEIINPAQEDIDIINKCGTEENIAAAKNLMKLILDHRLH